VKPRGMVKPKVQGLEQRLLAEGRKWRIALRSLPLVRLF
jgi:hypothetical protein